MTAPRNANTSTGGKRFYSWRSENYWSVTTILSGGLPKPALLPWGIKMVAEGAVDAVQRGILLEMVEQDADGAIRWLKGLPYAKRDKAADIGTALHATVEAYVLGKPMPKPPLPLKPRMAQLERFLMDYEPVYEMTEASVYNRTERYAGTLDAIATVGGRKLVIDVKSGKDIYPEIALQLAAYRHAEFVGAPDGSEQPMVETDGAAGLHLADDSYKFIHVDASQAMFKSFLYVREVFRFQTDLASSVLGGPVAFPGSETEAQLALAKEVYA